MHVLGVGLVNAGVAAAQTAKTGSTATPRRRRRRARYVGPSTLSGVYTDEQAARGKDVYLGTLPILPHAGIAHRRDVRQVVAREASVRSIRVRQHANAEERSREPGAGGRRRRHGVPAQDERRCRSEARASRRRRFAQEVPHRDEAKRPRLPPQRGRNHDATLVDGRRRSIGIAAAAGSARRRRRVRSCAHAVERASRAPRSCAATSRANGATGAPTRGARATRALDQINAQQLQLAAGRVAVERRHSTARTSTTARRRSTRTAGCSPSRRRAARRSRSIPRPARRSGSGASTKASAGRRRRASSPAAASPTGPTAPNERVIVVTPGYHLASLDAKTGKPRSEVRQGRRRRSRWTASAIRSCRSPSTTRVRSIISEAAPARKAKPGEKWDRDDEDRRRRHDRHRSGATARSPPARRRSSSAT